MKHLRYRVRSSFGGGYFVSEVKANLFSLWESIADKNGFFLRVSMEDAERVCQDHKDGKFSKKVTYKYLDI